MQLLEASGAVRPLYWSLGVKGLITDAHSSLSTAYCRHLPQILLYIFQPSQSRYSPSSSLRFTLKYFLNSPSIIHSYISNTFHPFLFNTCYYV